MSTYIFVIIFLALVWAFIVNEITYRQRMRLIQNIYVSGQWTELRAETFLKIGYFDHFFRLLSFRNPRKLYGSNAWLLDKPERY